MKKFNPYIIIYTITLFRKEDEYPVDNFYFLTYKRAHKFHEKHMNEYIGKYHVVIGGEPLFLW